MNTKLLSFHTKQFFEVINITKDVQTFLSEIGAKEGIVNIFAQHTTIALKINEDEAGFHNDLKRIMSENIAPPGDFYHHNDLENRDPATICPISKEECLNGHSHIFQMLLGSASESVPVLEGKMQLGTWQQIFMIELDSGRDRKVLLSFVGETR
ncbi:MAG TPA: secondary thiamine-phosphate synthase enzyme YjbQ [Candidatus Gracilibacteria bacterium]